MMADDLAVPETTPLIRLALRYAREDGISLEAGQSVPMGWLTANHETGRSDVAATAHQPDVVAR